MSRQIAFPLQNQYTFSWVPIPKWLVIFVHWLTSSQHEGIFVEWEKYFNNAWYSTLRFNLYWDGEGERKLEEVCLQDNIDDVNSVIKYAYDLWYKSVFLVWHSYGCIANLYANLENIQWLLMRDPSIWWKWLIQDVYVDEDWYYIDRWNGYKYRIGGKLYNDFQIPSSKFLEKMSQVNIPVMMIWAENWLANVAKQYFETANHPKELKIIKWAYHRFDLGWMKELLSSSLERIKQSQI